MKLTVKSVLLLLSSFLLQPKLGAMNGLTSEARKEAFKKIQQRVMLANSKRNMTGGEGAALSVVVSNPPVAAIAIPVAAGVIGTTIAIEVAVTGKSTTWAGIQAWGAGMFRPYESRRPVETDDRKPDQPKSDHKSETQLAAERDAKIARVIEHKKEFAVKEAVMTEEGLSWLKEQDKKRKDTGATSKTSAAAPASKGWFGGLFGSSNPPAPRQETTKTSCFPVQEKPDKVVPEAKPAKDTVIKGAVKEKEDLFSLKREEKKPKGGAKPENPNPRNGNKEPEARLENTPKKTTKEVQKELGPDWVKVKVDADTHGSPAFKNIKTGEIVSPDTDGHSGSHYKKINKEGEKRIASLDKDLKSFKD